MEMFIAVGVLFGTGYVTGYGVRVLITQVRGLYVRREREVIPEIDYTEGPAWMR